MTKPKKKLSGLLKFAAMVVLLAVIVPSGYMYLSGNGALESFQQVFAGTEETLTVNDEYAESLLPGEAVRVGGVVLNKIVEPVEEDKTGPEDNEAPAQTEDLTADPAVDGTENAEKSADESPNLIGRLLELIFGHENKVEVYE